MIYDSSMFQKWCKPGAKALTLDDFISVCQLPKDLAIPVFAYFDLDCDRSVDDFEFITTLVHLTFTEIPKRLSALFSIFDLDSKETIPIGQFDTLIEIIFKACCGNRPNLDSVEGIAQKLSKLKSENYLNDSYVTTDQFSKVVLADVDLLAALSRIGILSPHFETKEALLDDLDIELQKFDHIEGIWSDMSMTENGLDRRSEIDSGILDTLMIKAANSDTTKPFEKELGTSRPEYFSLEKVGLDEVPNASIKPEYIYGYRCYDTRNNLFTNSKGELVYHVAKSGIVLDAEQNKQKFFIQHTNAVSCLDVYGDLAVSGELGSRPILCLWDCTTSEISAVLATVIKEGAGMVRFANAGKRIIVSTVGENRNIYILDVDRILQGARKGTL